MVKNNTEYAIFIDIDGTLMGKNDDALLKNIETIQKVRSFGHKVFISTGRSTAYLPKELCHETNFDGTITGGGAIIKLGTKELDRNLMSRDLIEKFSRFVLKNNLQGFLEGEKDMYHFGFSDRAEKDWPEITEENLGEVLASEIPIEKFTVLGDIPIELDEIMGDTCTVLRFAYYGEIIQKSCGKGKALLDTIDALGIPVQRSVAIGDSLNDFDMLKTAGISVAMGNATDEIKGIADIVTDKVDDAGVSAALKKIFDI